MEKQLEILKALLDGKKVYGADGTVYRLLYHHIQLLEHGTDWSRQFNIETLGSLTLTPPNKPLTFERIRKECVSGKHLLVDEDGKKRMFLAFNRNGQPVTDWESGFNGIAWEEHEIKDWTIEEYKGEE